MKKTFILASALLATLYTSSALANSKDSAAATVDESTVRNVIPDTTITAALKAKFMLDDKVKALKTEVTTVNGVVTLTFTDPNTSDDAKKAAVQMAETTNGVKSVTVVDSSASN